MEGRRSGLPLCRCLTVAPLVLFEEEGVEPARLNGLRVGDQRPQPPMPPDSPCALSCRCGSRTDGLSGGGRRSWKCPP